jgi:AcrR family transcriptional regulator
MKSEDTKNRIIDTTISLIENLDGDIKKITIRKIAEKAGIGVGLINHYFGTKDNLIEVCVQKIIEKVVYHRTPEVFVKNEQELIGIDRLKATAKYIMNFLFEHPQISYISILGDFKKPHLKDNSVGTVYGFVSNMPKTSSYEGNLIKAFELVALMQVAFMKKDILKELCNINLEHKEERENYIDSLVDVIMGDRI